MTDDEDDDESETDDGRVIEDTRLILVTDLGFIVKQAKDGSRDVFVQSIRTGLAGRGRADRDGRQQRPSRCLTATTDATGRAQLPRPSPTEARREKTPLLILAQKDDDLSFMPFRIERARARLLALRHRRRRKRAVGAAAVELSVLGPRHLSSRRDDASRASSRGPPTGKRRSPGLPLDGRDHRSARPGRQPHADEAVGRRRSTRSPTPASRRRRPAPTRPSPIS